MQVDAFGPESVKCNETCKRIIELENAEIIKSGNANLHCRPQNEQSNSTRAKPSLAMFDTFKRERDEI